VKVFGSPLFAFFVKKIPHKAGLITLLCLVVIQSPDFTYHPLQGPIIISLDFIIPPLEVLLFTSHDESH
jgi:hypothetical protein